MDIQIISCTNRPGNLSIFIARHYEAALNQLGLATELLNLESLAPNILETDLYGPRSDAFQQIQAQTQAAARYLFVAPEYNGSLPGIFKIFVDATDYPNTFLGKKGWSVGLSAGMGGNAVGLQHLKDIMAYMGTEMQEEVLTIGLVREKLTSAGELTSPVLTEEMNRHAEVIADHIRSEL